MDEALSQRVELRAADRQASETILGKLGTELIDSIEYCRLLGIKGLLQLGFSQLESQLLILDDKDWASRHDAWLNSFLMLLPACFLQNTAVIQAIRAAIVKEEISSRNEFVKRFTDLNLPESVVIVLRNWISETDQVCRTEPSLDGRITSGSRDAHTSQPHEQSSVQIPNDGAVGANESEATDPDLAEAENILTNEFSLCYVTKRLQDHRFCIMARVVQLATLLQIFFAATPIKMPFLGLRV
jgi:hypothetical protein